MAQFLVPKRIFNSKPMTFKCWFWEGWSLLKNTGEYPCHCTLRIFRRRRGEWAWNLLERSMCFNNRFIIPFYDEGDNIFVFIFLRGAFTLNSLQGGINDAHQKYGYKNSFKKNSWPGILRGASSRSRWYGQLWCKLRRFFHKTHPFARAWGARSTSSISIRLACRLHGCKTTGVQTGPSNE